MGRALRRRGGRVRHARPGLGAPAVIGVLVLLATLARVWDRLRNGRLPYEEGTPVWARWLSRITHEALFAILVVMPIAGAAAWFGMIEEAGDLHGALWTPLLVLIALHVAGAAVEQVVFGTGADDGASMIKYSLLQ